MMYRMLAGLPEPITVFERGEIRELDERAISSCAFEPLPI